MLIDHEKTAMSADYHNISTVTIYLCVCLLLSLPLEVCLCRCRPVQDAHVPMMMMQGLMPSVFDQCPKDGWNCSDT